MQQQRRSRKTDPRTALPFSQIWPMMHVGSGNENAKTVAMFFPPAFEETSNIQPDKIDYRQISL
jgi:hypothetical protein